MSNRRGVMGASALALAALAVVGASTRAVAVPAGPTQEDLPCGVTYDRTVTPHQVVVNETVHVAIEVNGACTSESKGINIFFVVDRTITMRSNGYLAATQDALKDFLNAMPFPQSHAGLITYAANDQVNVPLTQDRQRVISGVDRIRIQEETDVRGLTSAFRTATELIDRDGDPENEKIVLVVAAGPDQDGALVNMPTVTQAARNAGVLVIFMMFPDSRYLHYVEASSDCVGSHCQTWSHRSGTWSKWAYPVEKEDPNSIGAFFDRLVPVLLRGVTIDRLEVEEFMSSGATVVESSVQPPPTHFAGGAPYRDMVWEFDEIPPGGLHIEYDAQMVLEDETYPVTLLSELDIWDTAGNPPYQRDLPNPDITVLGQVVPTESPTPTATDAGPEPTDTPTATDEPVDTVTVFLPVAVSKASP